MSDSSTALLWFRRDLRLHDNPALVNALQAFDQVLPVYIHAPDEEAPWQPGAASNWWLHNSLLALQSSLQKHHADLLIMQGDSLSVIQQLVDEYDIRGVFWNRLYEPASIKRDSLIKQTLKQAGILCHSFQANLINEPHSVLNGSGKPYRVFSAYWRSCESSLEQSGEPLAAPEAIVTPDMSAKDVSVEALQLMPKINWYQGMAEFWNPGEQGALQELHRFLQMTIDGYKEDRDIPSVNGTSKLSPHLHFGEISPRQIVWSTNIHAPATAKLEEHRYRFFAELGWREFAHYVLYHFPDTQNHSLDSRFDTDGWVDASQLAVEIERWQRGMTGIPIVDAGMRELWHTGWMHNRVRMIVASLLCKNLGVHWLEGARWFWDTLVDADLAANSMGWQWTAGCGVDAAPYFRVFSPSRQTERFDAEGEYIRRWVPELKKATNKQLINGTDLQQFGDYPKPLVDLSESRKQALSRWDQIKQAMPAKSA